MKIFIGTDHAGFELKNQIVVFLRERGYEVEDMGAHEFSPNDDYPDFIRPVAQAVARQKGSLGIVLGASGQGEAIVANRVRGVRAAVYYGGNPEIVTLSKEHNDANILSLGARFLPVNEALLVIDLWLRTEFSHEERHARRIRKIDTRKGIMGRLHMHV